MAPSQPEPANEAPKKDTTTKSNGIVKRPGRGFHRFRDGMLNVTPKGDEKKLAESNRQSPLLRLPAEIRNQIWALVLGGQAIRISNFKRKPRFECDRFPLLRVCRQICSEAVHFPMQKNIICLPGSAWVTKARRKLKTYQRARIEQIAFPIFHEIVCPPLSAKDVRVLKEMRNLKRVRVSLNPSGVPNSATRKRIRHMVSSLFDDGRERGIEVLIYRPRPR